MPDKASGKPAKEVFPEPTALATSLLHHADSRAVEDATLPLLSPFERALYDVLKNNWPSHALEVAEHFREDVSTRDARRRASTKYTYHLNKLVEKELLFRKEVGNAYVFWPLAAEKYRSLHHFLK